MLSKSEGGLEADLGAEKIITAEKGLKKIAIEIKSFLSPSIMYAFHTAFGQYLIYLSALEIKQNERILYLAIPKEIYLRLIRREVIRKTIEKFKVKLIIYNPQNKSIDSWKE